MDMPPTGWYPDPYGVPGLLRWWDGSTWTQHTHEGSAPEPPDATSLDATRIGDAPVPRTAGQPAAAQPPTGQAPAGQAPTVQAPAAKSQDGQPTALMPGGPRPAWEPGANAGGPPEGSNGTRVLFMDEDAWTAAGIPGGPAPARRSGYGRAHRRKRLLLGLLAGGTAVVLALIALAVTSLNSGSGTPAAARSPATPAQAAAAPSSSQSPSPSPSVSTVGGGITDSQTGLSYALLSAPWGNNGCPAALSNSQILQWTAGESAPAGQVTVNGNQTTWYGAACSGPLLQGYNYGGVAGLEPAAMDVVQQLTSQYYNALSPQYTQEASQPVSVSGHAGWEVEYQMTYPSTGGTGSTFTTELGEVAVIDEGNGAQPAVFLVSVPSNLGTGLVSTLASSIRLSGSLQPGDGAGSATS